MSRYSKPEAAECASSRSAARFYSPRGNGTRLRCSFYHGSQWPSEYEQGSRRDSSTSSPISYLASAIYNGDTSTSTSGPGALSTSAQQGNDRPTSAPVPPPPAALQIATARGAECARRHAWEPHAPGHPRMVPDCRRARRRARAGRTARARTGAVRTRDGPGVCTRPHEDEADEARGGCREGNAVGEGAGTGAVGAATSTRNHRSTAPKFGALLDPSSSSGFVRAVGVCPAGLKPAPCAV